MGAVSPERAELKHVADGLQSQRQMGKSLWRCGVEVGVRSTGFMENVVSIWRKNKTNTSMLLR